VPRRDMYQGTTFSRAEKPYKYWALALAHPRFQQDVPIENRVLTHARKPHDRTFTVLATARSCTIQHDLNESRVLVIYGILRHAPAHRNE
jgi:hypothetical protein